MLSNLIAVYLEMANNPAEAVRHVGHCQRCVPPTDENRAIGRYIPGVPYFTENRPTGAIEHVQVDHQYSYYRPSPHPDNDCTAYLTHTDLYNLKCSEAFERLMRLIGYKRGQGQGNQALYFDAAVLVATDRDGVPLDPEVPLMTAQNKIVREDMSPGTVTERFERCKRLFKIIITVPFEEYRQNNDVNFHAKKLKVRRKKCICN